ncbi:sulfotransferase domain-containing protein [Celeribacter marinus]|uniref:sulfotransferase domain-containing protein n=1 Tax=Celeribacter marinus TaxID=1397108 RepID=UPI003F6D796A
MTVPDVIIIGAMKCATSTLAAQLGAQDGVFLTQPKEPNFFSDDDIYAKGAEWYGALFEGAGAGDIKLEASTHYSKRPTYPHTIARLQASGARPKLIYIVRDPVDRLVSHYIHEWTQGVIPCGLDEAVQSFPELIEYSLYGKQITPWIDAFGADAILLLTMEDMTKDPQVVLSRVGSFIGHDNLEWFTTLGRVNASSERIKRFPFHRILFDNKIAQTLRRSLVPKSLRDALKAKRQMQARPVLSAEIQAGLRDIFAADGRILAGHFPRETAIEDLYSKGSI